MPVIVVVVQGRSDGTTQYNDRPSPLGQAAAILWGSSHACACHFTRRRPDSPGGGFVDTI